MRLYALIFTLCVLRAQAASIPAKIVPDLEKKLIEEIPQKDNGPNENISSEQELIDQANPVKDVENNLRRGIKDIPVKVVVEDVKIALKTDSEKKPEDNEVVEDNSSDIKRVEIDLNNPGKPEHQEHDTQSPEHFEDNNMQKAIENIKKNIADTQIVFKQGLKGVADDIQNWFSNNEQISSIQQSIQSLQISFTNQISKLNETIQGYFKPQSSVPANPIVSEIANDVVKEDIKKVELRIKTLENNFESGVKTLTEGVEVLATLRAENENAAAAVVPANPPTNVNPFSQYLQTFQNTISQGFANMTTAIQNYISQNQQNNQANGNPNGPGVFLQGIGNIFQGATPAGVQSDDAGATTSKPGIWQGLQTQFQNIFNQGQVQSDQPSQGQAPAGPFVQAIQNNPILQGIANIIQPKPQTSTAKPVSTQDASQAGTNVVPVNEKPESDAQQKPEQQVIQSGPIRQMIQNNPVVQNIAGTLQRIQDSIKPEKPRDTVKDKPVTETEVKGHGSWGSNNDGDNTDGTSGIENVPVKSEPEEIKEVKKEADKVKDVLNKTE